MGKLNACLLLATLAACGSDNTAKKPDAPNPDAAIDAKVFMDAPIDAPPMFDFSCTTTPAPTTADDPVTISGTATEISASGIMPTFTMLSGATVDGCTGNCSG